MRQAIAIVDSDTTSLRAMRGLLSALDVDVTSYQSGKQFLSGVGAEPPACVIVEAPLTDMSGVEFLKKIRANNSDVPVILVSADDDVSAAVDAMRHGATDFIEKPRLDVVLLRRVSQLLHVDDSAGYRSKN